MNGFVEIAFNLPPKREFTYSVPDGMAAQVGCRVSAPFGPRLLTGLVVGARESPPEGLSEIREIARVIDKHPLFEDRFIDLGRWMAKMYLCSLGEALFAMLPGGRREGETEELPLEEEPRLYGLAEQQVSAIEKIVERGEGVFYLFGVTGSGKTDVYLAVARKTTANGLGVIYLVPEISLTHQVVRLFRAIYGPRLAVLHSSLTPSQRLGEWRRVADGAVDVVIGARSAVFAPFRRLGLVVIDEEHEGSYKSGTTPRYHARQVAMYRIAKERGILLMGSATPSLETYHAMSEGRIQPLRLPERLSGGEMPAIDVVDMRKQKGPLSPALIDEIARTRQEGRQAILFLNRRGFAYFFHCRSCGYQMTCSHCSVTLTYHRDRERMICHYCGYAVEPLRVCPSCESLDVGYSGYGTEGLEEEIRRFFPHLVVQRVDTDAARKRKVLRQTLEDFREGRIHILLGTQMVAKGLNFPGVKLVGIINADTGFQMPDFRAAERTFALLVQVSGRAGRSLPDGKVLIQTFMPHASAIAMAREGRLEEFYGEELAERRQLGFPPYTRLIRLVLRGRNRQKTLDSVRGLAEHLMASLGETGEMLGPAECPISRIAGNWRYHVIVRAGDFAPMHARLSEALEEYRTPAGQHLEVDVDPQALL